MKLETKRMVHGIIVFGTTEDIVFLELESFSPTPLRSGGLVRAAGSSSGG
jgi:hypothetical protein